MVPQFVKTKIDEFLREISFLNLCKDGHNLHVKVTILMKNSDAIIQMKKNMTIFLLQWHIFFQSWFLVLLSRESETTLTIKQETS